jgi:outer membrane protein W
MKQSLLFILFFAVALPASAHTPFHLKGLLKPFHRIVLGISGVVIDDDGRPIKGVFNIKNSWNSSYIPSRLTFEAAFLEKWSAELSMAYSPLQAGKILGENNRRRTENVKLYTFDLSTKYYPLSLASKFLSPYAIVGLGYTTKKELVPNRGLSANAGLGLSVWLDKSLGVNVQCTGKFAVNNGASNYLMHTLGIVYRIAR